MTGAAVIALAGAAVGAVLTFILTLIDGRLRRRRQGRAAARLIWFELMGARATVRELKNVGIWVGDRPFRTNAWESARGAFTEVADNYAFAVVGLAYDELAALERSYDDRANFQLAKLRLAGTSPEALALAQARGPEVASALPERCFDALERALVQLDRYSRLAKRPVDYVELDKESGVRR